jgi:hypothetical protein
MTDTTGNDVVDAALDRLARTDRREADAARAAFASLTWGAGPDSVTLYGLCDWLWYRLPTKWMCGLTEHLQLADALGALFGVLEMPRYARTCTSEATANVLAAWDRDRKEGVKAMVAARGASGVGPPDVPGLLTWGEVMGTEENSALFATATRLEMLIAAGEFRPGARGWRKAAERAAATFLVTPRDDLDGSCWLQRIHAERLKDWAGSHGNPRGALTAALASQLERPAPVPRQAADLLAPVSWLLGKAAEDGGIPLTQSHTLARAVVAEGCQRFGWLTLTGRPRSESDIVEAWTLRTMIRELGAVRRLGRRLYLTSAGKALAAANTSAMWSAVMPAVLPSSRAEAAAAEIALMLLLTRGASADGDLAGTVSDAMATEGWHSPDSGQPIDSGSVGWLLGELLRRLRLLGLLEQRRGLTAARLTGSGRAAAHAALRAHALRPRDRGGVG